MQRERFNEQDVLLTFQEAAELLRVSRATMYRLLASGQLVGHKVGRGWRFYKRDIHTFVSAQDGSGVRKLGDPVPVSVVGTFKQAQRVEQTLGEQPL